MAKLYKDMTTKELKQEIKRIEEAQTPINRAYDTLVDGQTPLERYQKELERRAQP